MSVNNETCLYISAASLRAPNVFVDSAWHQHAPFAFHLMTALNPSVFVELGSHGGFSYFCFCQAAKEYMIGTSCYAVDTWVGDEHAGFYSAEIYNSVQRLNEPYAPFSTLMRMRFADALAYFPDGYIDLLHIDGRHFYDDVKEDFETWLPKLSENAVVIFHDTNVRERNFGVFQFFFELSKNYPTFEFVHGHGLGVLARGEVPLVLKPFFDADQRQKTVFRGLYSELGRHIIGMMGGAHLSVVLQQKDQELAAVRGEAERTAAALAENFANAEQSYQEKLRETRAALRHSYKRIAAVTNELESTRTSLESETAELHRRLRDYEHKKIKAIASWLGAVWTYPFNREKRRQFRAGSLRS